MEEKTSYAWSRDPRQEGQVGRAAARSQLRGKRVVWLEDGRYVIFYDFDDDGDPERRR